MHTFRLAPGGGGENLESTKHEPFARLTLAICAIIVLCYVCDFFCITCGFQKYPLISVLNLSRKLLTVNNVNMHVIVFRTVCNRIRIKIVVSIIDVNGMTKQLKEYTIFTPWCSRVCSHYLIIY